MFCTTCGNKILENQKFCTQCGKTAGAAAAETGSKKSRKWLTYLISFVFLGLFFGVLLFAYIGNISSVAKITARRDEVKTLLSGMGGDIKALGETMVNSSAKEKAKKYQEILQDINAGYTNIDDLNAKAKDAETKLAELKTLVNKSRDQAVKDSGLKFVDLAGQSSAANVTLGNDLRQTFDIGKKYFEALSAGKKASSIEAEMEKLLPQFQADLKSANDIVKNYDAAEADFAKALAASKNK